MPLTTPVLLTEAMADAAELHTPPVVVLDKVMVLLAQTVVGPVMVPAEGAVFTVSAKLSAADPQALETVYTIKVVPAAEPVTAPVVVLIEATVASLAAHVPPVMVDENDDETPVHKVAGPDRVPAIGVVSTVTGAVALTVPQLPVTV